MIENGSSSLTDHIPTSNTLQAVCIIAFLAHLLIDIKTSLEDVISGWLHVGQEFAKKPNVSSPQRLVSQISSSSPTLLHENVTLQCR